ncbi:DUF262 domain-containing protein [Arenibaculum sp.]|jgi:hypothetical protein|uniref:DUF262 domain-containing protein n=1 Tax=Arenibaculum sp. TaxID=2865862 RepID=UPI002E0DE3E3|nr:DUF262 domain-containing protein [Arenibaculum sp.]
MEQEPAHAEVKPEVVLFRDLVRHVVEGRVRIPRFQRPFVWRRDQMIDLLDSIRRQYPIGSLLIWETDTPRNTLDWVGPVRISPPPSGAVSLVLDGQQRLSTLVGVLRKPVGHEEQRPSEDDPGRWKIFFNAKDNRFEHLKPDESVEAWHFPLGSLLNTVSFINESRRIMDSEHEDAELFVQNSEQMAQKFSSYLVPVIRIKNTELSQAIEIFARLNSKGQSMTADQMVSALSYGENLDGTTTFDLAEEIGELVDRLDDFGFRGVDRVVVLRCFLATLKTDIYRTDWTRLADATQKELRDKLPTVIGSTGEALERAVRFLHELGVRSHRLLPYAMQLVVLCAFFLECPAPTEEQRQFLKRWFWVSSFTARFSSSNPSRDGYLVAEFRDRVSRTANPTTLDYMRLDVPAEPFPSTFDMRSARARTLLLVLLSLAPRAANGEVIPEPWRRIADHGPNAIGYLLATVNDKELRSSPANRILRIDMAQRRSQAKNWLETLADVPDGIRSTVLKSHGISVEAFQSLLDGDGEEFLRLRRSYLIDLERQFMSNQGVILPRDLEPKPAAIDNDED